MLGHQASHALQTRLIIGLAKINRAGNFRVHLRAAKFLATDFLTNRRLDQRGARQIQPTAFGHQQHIAQHRQIAAARHAVAHNGADLRNAFAAKHRVVAENATKVIGVRKDIFLQRKKYASAVHQI